MRIYVKRENWDGGLWLALPASDADAKKLMEELAQIHPSVMLPFVGEVDSGIKVSSSKLKFLSPAQKRQIKIESLKYCL